MARKRKGELPSGNVRVRLYIGKIDGKKKWKSFTGSTRAEAEAMACEWKRTHTNRKQASTTVLEALTRYVNLKEPVLSPSTVVGYRRSIRNYFENEPIAKIDIQEVRTIHIQNWISDISSKVGQKTVRNANALLMSALGMYDIGPFKVTLPQKTKPSTYCPSSEDMMQLLAYERKHGKRDILIAIMLAAFGPLRRSEICAITDQDIHGNTITISKAMVQNDDGVWVIKEPKTFGSHRSVEFPDFVMRELKGIEGRIVDRTPMSLSDQFNRDLAKAGLQHFRFHDLRHYAASILHAIGIPDLYIMQRAGWSSDYVMKNVYREVISSEQEKQTVKILDYFKQFE